MTIRRNPKGVAPPGGPYSHSVEAPAGARMLYISGEIGFLPDGTLAEGIEAQAEAVWRNLETILADADMGIGDLIKITTYLTRPEDLGPAAAARARHLGDARPASATVIVARLVDPAMLIEIEAVAAKA